MDSRDNMINAVDTALKQTYQFVPLRNSIAIADSLLEQGVQFPNIAHWVPKETMIRTPFAKNYYCSNCGKDSMECGHYCGNCGALMEEKNE